MENAFSIFTLLVSLILVSLIPTIANFIPLINLFCLKILNTWQPFHVIGQGVSNSSLKFASLIFSLTLAEAIEIYRNNQMAYK